MGGSLRLFNERKDQGQRTGTARLKAGAQVGNSFGMLELRLMIASVLLRVLLVFSLVAANAFFAAAEFALAA